MDKRIDAILKNSKILAVHKDNDSNTIKIEEFILIPKENNKQFVEILDINDIKNEKENCLTYLEKAKETFSKNPFYSVNYLEEIEAMIDQYSIYSLEVLKQSSVFKHKLYYLEDKLKIIIFK